MTSYRVVKVYFIQNKYFIQQKKYFVCMQRGKCPCQMGRHLRKFFLYFGSKCVSFALFFEEVFRLFRLQMFNFCCFITNLTWLTLLSRTKDKLRSLCNNLDEKRKYHITTRILNMDTCFTIMRLWSLVLPHEITTDLDGNALGNAFNTFGCVKLLDNINEIIRS